MNLKLRHYPRTSAPGPRRRASTRPRRGPRAVEGGLLVVVGHHHVGAQDARAVDAGGRQVRVEHRQVAAVWPTRSSVLSREVATA